MASTWPPGVASAVSFYRHFAFDLPRLTTMLGAGLSLGLAAVHLVALSTRPVPDYLGAYLALVGAVAVAVSAGMVVGGRLPLVRAAWALGSLLALAVLVVYLVSRSFGLPDLPQLRGRWDDDRGTVVMALSAAFLALHATVLTGLNVAYPRHQQWHD